MTHPTYDDQGKQVEIDQVPRVSEEDDGLTAAGTNQATALALVAQVNRLDTVASGTGVKLPSSVPGMSVKVHNNGANTLQVYGLNSDTINGIAAATGIPLLVGSVTTFVCTKVGAWVTENSPSGSAPGYTTGQGGAVTQATSRTTGVTLNNLCGTITTNTASLAAEAAATFTVTNSQVAIGDVVVVSQQSGSNGGNTAVNVVAVAAGSFNIQVSNNNAAAGTAETGAILINFAVIKAVAA